MIPKTVLGEASTNHSAIRVKLAQVQQLKEEAKARRALEDMLYWIQECTTTKDYQEKDPTQVYKPFPRRQYFQPILDLLPTEPIIFIEKSRTMMLSWLISAWAAWTMFTRKATGVVFQSEDEDRAVHDVEYCKVLWEQSIKPLRDRWGHKHKNIEAPYNLFELENDSWCVGLPGRPGKIRSEHPTIVIFDEAAHMEEFKEAFHVALGTYAPHIVALSSAKPGPFREMTRQAVPVDWPGTVPGQRVREGQVWTPCKGLSMRRTKEGWPVIRLHITAREDISPEKIQALRKNWSSYAHYRQEIDIDYEAFEGRLVYPEFNPDIHVLPDEMVRYLDPEKRIPRMMCRMMSIDPHPRTPHAMLWIGIDRWSDWYVYRELWPSIAYGQSQSVKDDEADNTYTIREYCETLAALEGNRIEWKYEQSADEYGSYVQLPSGERIVDRFMDQAGKHFMASGESDQKESYAERYTRYGITCMGPNKAHRAGEDAIRDLLKPRRHEMFGTWPKLHIAASCQELIHELRSHRYQKVRRWNDERELRQVGIEARCHQIDNLRYLATANFYYTSRLESAQAECSKGTLCKA